VSEHSTDPAADVAALLDGGARRVEILGARGSYGAFLLAAIARERPVLAVTPDFSAARRLARDLRFYLGRTEAPASLLDEPVLLYPDRGTSPYSELSAERDVLHRRLAILFALAQGFLPRALVLPVQALQERVLPRPTLCEASDFLVAGDTCDREKVIARLVGGGYSRVPVVEDRGTFAVRGFILDIFPPLYRFPVRVELVGETVESIRLFDPSSQRSIGPLREVYFGPAREELYTPEATARARRALKERADEAGMPSIALRRLLDDLDERIYFFGIESFLPAFHERLVPLFDYLPGVPTYYLEDPAQALQLAQERFAAESEARERRLAAGGIAFPAAAHYLERAEIEAGLARGPQILENPLELAGAEEHTVRVRVHDHQDLSRQIAGLHGKEHALKPLADRLHEWSRQGMRMVVACHTQGQRERLKELLADYGIHAQVAPEPFAFGAPLPPSPRGPRPVELVAGDLTRGFSDGRLAILAEEEIFGARVRRRPQKPVTPEKALRTLRELAPGDLVVHADHGIGRYLGLTRLRVGGAEGDYLLVEYAGGDKLYLPILRLGRVEKYVGPGEEARLDKMGGAGFAERKRRVQQAALEIARELVDLYAAREASPGIAYSPPDAYFREFEAAFPYDETPDQSRAIDEVLADMQRDRPMDRLLCGDVGFGKTEVAMRAAMKAVLDGKQVAVLVPTTLLVQQHEQTFRSRFAEYPVRTAGLSRFKTKAEQKEILEGLRRGTVDIVVGTHRLLSEDVAFKDLGLVIIDEEHRFGVRAKEKLKALRKNVDVLAMTATPIPRTLQLSMGGIRDLSIIQSPPRDRLAIRTVLMKFDDDAIRTAIRSEIARGGQIFFVHNRVESIFALAHHLGRLVPEARIAVAHGQMPERELEKVMLDFVAERTNLLVSTAIIESGLDIPRANSIFINRADRFGLAELHQLRGRVGRAKERAFAYLLVPPRESLTPDALRRLEALTRFSDLGAGFQIASEDLEIRGAGNLLGTAQTGHIAAVGLDLYQELVAEAVRELRGEKAEERIDPEIQVDVSALLPEDYLPDAGQRLLFYRRLARAEDLEELDDLIGEIADRFGPLPEPVQALRDVLTLKILVIPWNIEGLTLQGSQLSLKIGSRTRLSPAKVIRLLESSRGRYRLTPDMVLSRRLSAEEMRDRMAAVRRILREVDACRREEEETAAAGK
jgi:transcription-repair coupling factor (superfamily II helicase)